MHGIVCNHTDHLRPCMELHGSLMNLDLGTQITTKPTHVVKLLTTKVTATIFFIISSSVLGQYAQRHFAQGHYAQGHYTQGNYVQTEITPKEITPKEITPKRKLRPRKLSYSKRIAAIIFRLLFEEVYIFFVWLGRFAPFAK